MDPQELLKLLQDAQDAMQRGASLKDVNNYIRAATGGQFAGVMSLTLAINPNAEKDAEEDQPIGSNLAVLGNVPEVNAFMRGLAQGATGKFADEIVGLAAGVIPGGLNREEATAASRAKFEAAREANPIAFGAGEVAGIAAGPGKGVLPAFRAIRGAGGVARTAAAGAATTAPVAGLLAAGGAEGGVGERLGAAVPAAAIGGTLGAGVGAAGPVIGGGRNLLGRLNPFKRVESSTVEALQNMVAEAGIPGGAAGVRQRLASQPPGTVIADLDPSLAARVPGILRQAPSLKRVPGPTQAVTARVLPKQVERARRAIWRPLEGQVVRDPGAVEALKTNEGIREAIRRVSKGNVDLKDSFGFRELQDARKILTNTLKSRTTLPSEYEAASNTLTRLDDILDQAVPGFRAARAQWRELLARQDGHAKLAKAIEKAVPTFNAGFPARIEGVGAMAKNAILNLEKKKTQVAEIVGEVLLAEGSAGVARLEQLIRGGFFTQVFRGLSLATKKASGQLRTPILSKTGERFGGTSGLLGEGDEESRFGAAFQGIFGGR